MTFKEAVKHCLECKLQNKPFSWVEIAKQANIHPERLRGKVRRKLKKHNKTLNNNPKILVFDIETAPLVTYIWNRWQKFIPDEQLIEDWFVISWAAKWLFDDNVMSMVVTPEEAKQRNDERVVIGLWELLNEADIVIAHNGIKFDIKHMNGRFLKHELDLPMPYQVIDTFRHSVKNMKIPSHGLNYIAKYLGLGRKDKTDFQLWLDAMKGDPAQLRRMDEYCRQDVRLLEDVYLKLRPYIQPHPNLGLYIESDVEVCPSCGSDELEKQGTYATTVNLYDAYRCKCCGSITRSRQSKIKKRQHITSSVPR